MPDFYLIKCQVETRLVHVDEQQALAEERLALTHRIVFTRHAREEMDNANVDRADVRNAILTAMSAAYQPASDRWRMGGGVACDGSGLVVVVVFEADLILITVW